MKTVATLLVAGMTLSYSVQAEILFTDNFDSGFTQWSSSGVVESNNSENLGGDAVRLQQTGQLWKTWDTTGYSNVTIEYYFAATLLEDPDYCYAEYSTDGGNQYTVVTSLTNGQDTGTFQHGLINTADLANNPGVVLRFRAAASTADNCFIENVTVTGEPGSGTPEADIQTSSSVNFGSVLIGSSVNQTLTVTNQGQADLLINSVSGMSGDLAVTADSCSSASLHAQSQCQITLNYLPSIEGSVNQSLSIQSNDPDQPVLNLPVSGYGLDDQGDGYVENYDPLSGSGSVSRSELTYTYLNGAGSDTQVPLSAFAVPANAAQPVHQFEGRIQLHNPGSTGQFAEQRDTFRYTGSGDDPRKHLPDFDFRFVQSGTHLIPETRGIVLGSHPYWEYILEPGRVWRETNDSGDSRAAIPFSLMQKNSNCVHNGLMSFTFNDNGMSDVAYQISSETCLYYQVDMWGRVAATYTPSTVTDALLIKQQHQAYEASKVPVKPITALASDYPAANVDVSQFGNSSEVSSDYMSVYGVYVDGTHYTAGCETRAGMHPYCDRLRVPSYSTAKSAMAGTATMRLEYLYPGYMQEQITDWLPEAANDPENDWQQVTVNNAIDMATGNYRLTSDSLSDEGSVANDTGFFLVEGHQNKLDYSVSRYPRNSEPGTLFIYHTTDTYIATATAQAYVKDKFGAQADVFKDIIVKDIWAPLNMDLGTQDTRRTYDSVKMPFGGYGLTFLRDDIVKLARFTSIDHGQVNGQQVLDPAQLDIALFRDLSTPPFSTTYTNKYYSNSFWSLKQSVPGQCDVHVPYMSGYGGIQFVMLPNDMIYYYVSDNDEFKWDKAFAEAGKIKPYCQ
ncbi:choice-of-anchor D domain-containing protein [Photobacterium salinisoli]|uniref:choice-of-anchor D domain-containing protein n=1 Tax=Photobacterium salinisoli TaxID=1616783 RepID=UPI000EA04E70|nr:choice-of-anchor D domain-containing protein [Photobacterium salinisoli]